MRPKVTVNCAMTADGKIAGKSRRQMRISSPEDMERVEKLRLESDAILVGIGTILSDNPHLTVKGFPPERSPVRVVLDSSGRTPEKARVLRGEVPTIIATAESCKKTWDKASVFRAGEDRVDIPALLTHLHEQGIERLLVEGGGEVVWSFFKEKVVDVFSVFVGNMIIGGRSAPTPVDGEGFSGRHPLPLELRQCSRLGEGVHLVYGVEGDE